MSLKERSYLAHYVWYIKPPDTLAGVFLFIENNTYQEDGGGGRGLAFYEAYEIGVALSE